jgi:hypothetical protein
MEMEFNLHVEAKVFYHNTKNVFRLPTFEKIWQLKY